MTEPKKKRAPGRPPKKVKARKITFNIPIPLIEKLYDYCYRRRVGRSAVSSLLLRDYLGDPKNKVRKAPAPLKLL